MTAADLDLDALAVAVEGMTEGPWRAVGGIDPPGRIDRVITDPDIPGPLGFITQVAGWGRTNDAAGIVALRNAAPALIAQARDAARLTRRVEALEAGLREALAAWAHAGIRISHIAEHRRLRSLLTPTKEADRAAE